MNHSDPENIDYDSFTLEELEDIAYTASEKYIRLLLPGFTPSSGVSRLTHNYRTLQEICDRKFRAQFTPNPTCDMYYALTLTSTDVDPTDLFADFDTIYNRYDVLSAALELTKQGNPHIHTLIHCKTYLNRRDIVRLKLNFEVFDLKKLKTKLDRRRWYNYLKKEDSKPSPEYLQKYDIESWLVTDQPEKFPQDIF